MKLFFRKTGEGKPLIILHGLFGMSDNWLTLAKKFGENNFEVYTVDQRNHGQSPHATEFNYEVLQNDLLGFIDEHHLQKISIIGHSLGAKTAMFFAVRHPERMNKLVIVDMAPRKYPVHHDGIISALRSIDLAAVSSRKEAEEQLKTSISDDGTRQFLLKNLFWKEEKLAWRFNLDAIEKNIEQVGDELNKDQGTFDGPVLFIKGQRSGYITSSDETEIKNIFPSSEIKSIDGAGHWVHADKPKEFFETLIEFLK